MKVFFQIVLIFKLVELIYGGDQSPALQGCAKDEHAPHPTDCSMYLQCDNGNFIERICPEGLHWNQAETYCDWPWNVDCTEGPAIPTTTTTEKPTTETTSSPTSSTTEFPSTVTTVWSTDLPEAYPTTENPSTFTTESPATDPTTPISSSPENPSTVTSESPGLTTELPTTNPTTNPSTITTESPNLSTELPTTDPTAHTTEPTDAPSSQWPSSIIPPSPPTSFTCPSTNPDKILLPHPNCAKFYEFREESGVVISRNCPKLLRWNPRNSCCDLAEEANCVYGAFPFIPDAIPEEEFIEDEATEPTTTSLPISSTSDSTPPEWSTITDDIPTTSPYFCPSTNPNLIFMPHPNCAKFYEYHRELIGIILEKRCPGSLHWNLRESCCNLPERANCVYGAAPLIPEAIPDDETSENESTTWTTPIEPSTPPEWSTITDDIPTTSPYFCPSTNPNLIFMPHPNCAKFYEYHRELIGIILEKRCPGSLHWNFRENCCNLPEQANCVYGAAPLIPEAIPDDETSENESTTWTTPTEPSTPLPTFPDGSLPNAIINMCPSPNLNVAYVAHPDCQRFYEFSPNFQVIYERSCPKLYYWNRKSNCCELASESNCFSGTAPHLPNAIPDEDTVTSSPTEPSTYPTTNLPTTPSPTTPPLPTFPGGLQPHTVINMCPSTNFKVGYIAHPDCQRFYEFSSNYLYVFERSCPDNHSWNRIFNCCELTALSNCIPGTAPLRPNAIPDWNTLTSVATEPTIPTIPEPTFPGGLLPHPVINMCPSTNFMVGYMAHPDCQRFYEFSSNYLYVFERSCPDTYSWNRIFNCCELAAQSNCIPGTASLWPHAIPDWGSLTSAATQPPTVTTTSTSNPTTEPSPSSPLPTFPDGSLPNPVINMCPSTNFNVGYIAHPDCQRFYEFSPNFQVIYERSCPETYHWNRTLSCCELATQSQCIAGTAPHLPNAIPDDDTAVTSSPTEPTIFTTTPTTPTSTTPSSTFPTIPDDSQPNPTINMCPATNANVGYMAHPNCERFYEFSPNNVAVYERACPIDHHWNRILNCCEMASQSNCIFGTAPLWPNAIPDEDTLTSSATTDPTFLTTIPSTNLPTTSSPTEPTTLTTIPSTDFPTTIWPTTLPTIPEDSKPNPIINLCPATHVDVSYLPHPNCERFYEISFNNEIIFERACPPSYYWRRYFDCCELAEESNCVFGNAAFLPNAIPDGITVTAVQTGRF